MNASASSSSRWPTMRSGDGALQLLPENVTNHRGRIEAAVAMFASSAWPTPTANDWKGSGPTLERSDGKMRGDRLDYATEQLWTTPSAGDGQRGGTITEAMSGTSLTQQVNSLWMTPRSHEVGQYQYSRGDKTKPVQTLTGQSLQWATPTQVHRKSEKAMRPFAQGGHSSPPAIEQQAETLVSFLPALTTSTVGEAHSRPRRSLNPLFVEWLMGWPPGWTLAAWTDFACSEMELSLWKQRMRSALLSLGLPREAPPAQLALFG
ncbi:hypothetical protein BKP54_25200 [Ensifer sp. 1H6]|nr:hypothetical protein BKP54_25200 [Ensifer sp. 1H6]